MPSATRLSGRTVRIMIVAAVALLGVAALVLNLPSGKPGGPFAGAAPPPLYPDTQLRPVEQLATAPRARALRDAHRWLAAHPARDDKAFAAFALGSVGPPPTGAAQTHELAALHHIDAGRTPAGVAAAVWLEAHGKKDVWKLYLKQERQFTAPAVGTRAKAVWKATYALANVMAATGKRRFARPSPYITDPSLHALNQSRFKKKFSYPAKHSVISFALAPVLAHYVPHRRAELRWMADEVSFSRLYAGGHYPSDVAAGVYLGTLLSQYELHVAPTKGA